MAAQEWQHEKRNAFMVPLAGAAALADCELFKKPAVRGGRFINRGNLKFVIEVL
jgi:hypothetical protein